MFTVFYPKVYFRSFFKVVLRMQVYTQGRKEKGNKLGEYLFICVGFVVLLVTVKIRKMY